MDTVREPATSNVDSFDSDEVVRASYVEHGAALERYVRSLVRDQDQAADICQEVFIRLLMVGRADRLPDVPIAWMRRVAHNLVISGARRNQTAQKSMGRLTDAEAHVPTIEDAIVRRERDAAIVDALARTAEDDRTAMLLAAQGYRGEEIAERIGRSELATRTLLCRARGRLRMRLAEGVGA